MYEEIRVKEGDRVFTISMSSEKTSDMEYLSLAFHSALMKYTVEHEDLRKEYHEVVKKYSDLVARNPSQYVGRQVFPDRAITPYDDPIFKKAVAEGAKRVADKIDEDITENLWSETAKQTASALDADMLRESILRGKSTWRK